ncbi:hypothetical protein [Jatrophihabitans endophyticus]|uniref:hypothetical protein n=1 Tax=Jatrophihabitans endophyticus TaxID=1206085 RepID=UPI0019E1DAD7|nr:hypothetical protein [Jatrophihabitans endophyticus]MBE7190117.1 hypothetical protein [Jatrophihabitans endophyticus]
MPSRVQLTSRMPRTDDVLAVNSNLCAVVEAQHGVATRTQLIRCGISAGQIGAHLAARRWRAIGRHVVVLTNAPLTAAQRQWAAVLLPEKPCALAGASACAQAGLTGFEPDRVHILVTHSTHVAAPTWVKIHESRRFTPADINAAGGLPRTTVARSLVDAAAWSSSPRRACAFLCAGVQQRLVPADRLAAALVAAGHVRHSKIMREIVGDISGGGHTLAEIEFGALARRAGLPSVRRQVLRRETDGRVRYLDVELDLPDGTRLAVEIDGGVHLQMLNASDDMDRQNEIVIDGQPVLRFASLTVRLDEARVVDQLSRFRLRHS